MAAYDAVASLLQILNDILDDHPPRQQIPPRKFRQVESLREKVCFLLNFVEDSSSSWDKNSAIEDLKGEIRDAAYAAEDAIESHISTQLLLEFCENPGTWDWSIVPANEDFERFDQFTFEFQMPFDKKLLFAAQTWICALTYFLRRNYVEEFVEEDSMSVDESEELDRIGISDRDYIYIQGYGAYRFFLLRSVIDKETLMEGGDQDLYRGVMKEISFILGTIEKFPSFLFPSSEANFVYTLLLHCGEHNVCQMISAAWNVVSALRQRVLVPRDEDLRKVMEEFHSIAEKVIKVCDACRVEAEFLLPVASSSRFDPGVSGRNILVGFDTEFAETKAHLVRDSSKVEIVSIVGMGGIGKTALARKVYEDPYIVYHFNICAWVTVSQEYSVRSILLGLLDSTERRRSELHKESDELLAEYLYKSLKGRRYLIVMDDVWDVKVWDVVRRYFPDDNNSSRILLTTRLLDVAEHANSCRIHRMRFLTKEESWSLISKKAFAEEECPPELREVGKEIAHNCGGLPLAIVVAGGLLSKVSRTPVCWRDVADNLISLVSKDDEKCLNILSLSYNRLPHHLRLCFLYMAVFPEDFEIPISKLICLWAAEGILKPHISKSLELVAEEYLEDLIQRSLVSISSQSCDGKVKTCSIHDLLRELCLRNAEKENFFYVSNFSSGVIQNFVNIQRRLSIHPYAPYTKNKYYSIVSTWSHARSLLSAGSHLQFLIDNHLLFRLLRVLDIVRVHFSSFPREISALVNLRYLALTFDRTLPPSILKMWNLQTILHHSRALGIGPLLPLEIWMMPKLRHLWFTSACFQDSLGAECFLNDSVLLKNLQTLMVVRNFKFSKNILRRIRNLKKLGVSYDRNSFRNWSSYEFENILDLHHLKILKFFVKNPQYNLMPHAEKLAFPLKLRKLTLSGCRIPWRNMTAIGSLPDLEVLKLRNNAFQGREWDTVEGEFLKLKFLLIEETNLVHWRADSTHFPSLQHLIIRSCSRIEIPSSIGDISTLQMIELFDCGPSAVNSAKQIREEQQDMGNDYLEVRVDSRQRLNNSYKSRIVR